MSVRSTSHGHSGLEESPITSSTMVRAMRGTIAWPALPRMAATKRDLDVALVLPDLAAQPADPPLRGVLAG